MPHKALPFDVAPTPAKEEIGDPENGVLRFTKRRSISTAERLLVREVDRSDDLLPEVAALCRQIQEASQREVERCMLAQGPGPSNGAMELHQQLAGPLSNAYLAVKAAMGAVRSGGVPSLPPVHAHVLLEWLVPVKRLAQAEQDNLETVTVRKATTMIQTRLQGCEDWTDDDTAAIGSERMIAEIAAFFDREMLGPEGEAAASTLADQLAELEATLGKLEAQDGGPPQSRTGQPSTGSSKPPSQGARSSRRNGLAA